MGFNMLKKIIFFISITLLSACGDSPIDDVKKQHFDNFSDYTIGELLDNRGVCANIEWSEDKENKTVLYTCTLNKGTNFYNFNDDYANNLRQAKKQEGLAFYAKRTTDIIEDSKQKLTSIKEQNAIIDKLLNDKNNMYILYRNEEYKNYIYMAVREYNMRQDSFEFKSKAGIEFGLMSHTDITFTDFQDVYQYLVENEKNDSVNHRLLTKKIEGDDQEGGLYEHCVGIETYDAIQTMLKDESWLNEVNSKHNLEMKKLCIEHLKGFESDTYSQDLDKCIEESYKPDYKKLVREQGLSNEIKDKISKDCSNKKEQKIADYHDLLDQYNTFIHNELVSVLNNQLSQNKKSYDDAEDTLKFYESTERTAEENKEADKYAENNVIKYSLNHVLKGEEKILWEYNKISKKYIIKNMQTVQYEYGGKTMTSSLFLDILIYSAMNNVNDIDSYMNIRQKKAAENFRDFYNNL